MNDQQTVTHALRCLQILDQHPATAPEVCAATGLPQTMCEQLLDRLNHAGLIQVDTQGHFVLEQPLGDLSPLDILDAVWETFVASNAIRMLIGTPSGVQAACTQAAVEWSERSNRYLSDGGVA